MIMVNNLVKNAWLTLLNRAVTACHSSVFSLALCLWWKIKEKKKKCLPWNSLVIKARGNIFILRFVSYFCLVFLISLCFCFAFFVYSPLSFRFLGCLPYFLLFVFLFFRFLSNCFSLLPVFDIPFLFLFTNSVFFLFFPLLSSFVLFVFFLLLFFLS